MLRTMSSADRSIRPLARQALSEFGVGPCRLAVLASRHNDVFSVTIPTVGRHVLRLQNAVLCDAEANLQLRWMESLSADSGIVVPSPVRTLDGRPFTHVGPDHRRAVLLRWVPGRPAKNRGNSVYQSAAKMIARMHDHPGHFRPRDLSSCRVLDGDSFFGDRLFTRHPKAKKHVDRSQRNIVSGIESFVRNAMEQLGHHRRGFGLIHADLNLDNVVFHHGIPSPIDFDEFGRGWHLFDLAELIRTSISPTNWRDRKKLAIDAYTQVRALDDRSVECFDAFIAATFMQYLNWAFANARNDDDLKWVGFCVDVLKSLR